MTNFTPVAPGTGLSVPVASAHSSDAAQAAAPTGFLTHGPWLIGGLYIVVLTSPLMSIVEEDAEDKLWYCITEGKFVGVTTSNSLALRAVSRVSGSSMAGHKTQALAIQEFNQMLGHPFFSSMDHELPAFHNHHFASTSFGRLAATLGLTSLLCPPNRGSYFQALRRACEFFPVAHACRNDCLVPLPESTEDQDNLTLVALLARLNLRGEDPQTQSPRTPSPPPYSTLPLNPVRHPHTLPHVRPRAEPPSTPTVLRLAPPANPTRSRLAFAPASETIYHFDSPGNTGYTTQWSIAGAATQGVANASVHRVQYASPHGNRIVKAANGSFFFLARSWVRVVSNAPVTRPIQALPQPQNPDNNDEENPLNGDEPFNGNSLCTKAVGQHAKRKPREDGDGGPNAVQNELATKSCPPKNIIAPSTVHASAS
ncbi:hypothetical protein C8R43DRAFT_953499 [Mycena crocata]|nr:hypothetical protein C8R43DRAFT_953499 [Mycena crocata]